MTKKEKNEIFEYVAGLSDEQMEKEYYDLLLNDVLGSQAEAMEDAGWEDIDISERRKYETFACQKSALLESLCEKRGIKLFQ